MQPPTSSQSIALRLQDVTKRFGTTIANDGVTFEVRRGEIHALLGENGAGKSTLMNLVYGLHQPDAGQIEVDGQPVRITGPDHALRLGIGMVHQHFMLVPDMTVCENIALRPARLPRPTRLKQLRAEVRSLSERYGLAAPADARIDTLSLGDRQRVEILRLLHRGAQVLILDEPTAALTPLEWRALADTLRSLADAGAAIVIITHKLEEVFDVAERCTVLRDGRVVGTVAVAEADRQSLARLMVGRDVVLTSARRRVDPGDANLQLRSVTVRERERDVLSAVTLDVRAGEVVGIAGVAGKGQRALVQAVLGLAPTSDGEIRLCGDSLRRRTPKSFMERGGAVIPEDRHEEGVALALSVADNLLMKDLCAGRFVRFGRIDRRRAAEHCSDLIGSFGIKTVDADASIAQLSGGHQQKVVLAREISRGPKVIIAAQPTRGLDVGAIEFVHEQINRAKENGAAVLLISSELEEILALSDRVAVMVSGRIVSTIDRDEVDLDELGMLMSGQDLPIAGRETQVPA